MRMSFWQFMGLLAALGALYYFYNYWWLEQDRGTWINKMNSGAYKSADEMEESKAPPAKESSSWP